MTGGGGRKKNKRKKTGARGAGQDTKPRRGGARAPRASAKTRGACQRCECGLRDLAESDPGAKVASPGRQPDPEADRPRVLIKSGKPARFQVGCLGPDNHRGAAILFFVVKTCLFWVSPQPPFCVYGGSNPQGPNRAKSCLSGLTEALPGAF